MKKRLYLHIGMDKTGTSTIQWMMNKNRKLIFQLGDLYYPKTGLWHDYSHHPFAFAAINLAGYSEHQLSLLLKDLKHETIDKENILISSECLFKATTGKNFQMFQDYILKNFHEVKIIVYVRRQDLWVESRYKHSILSGSLLSLENLQTPHFCNYKQFIDCWSKVIGRKNIIVRAYEKTQFVNNSIFSDFLSIFGLSLNEKYKLPTKLVNSSLEIDGCEFKKMCIILNNRNINMDELNTILLKYAEVEKKHKHDKRLLSPMERLDLIETYSDINEKIALDYLNRKNGKLFCDVLPNINEPYEKYKGLTEEVIIEISKFIVENNAKLFNKLTMAIEQNLKSEEPYLISIAEKLRPVLNIKQRKGNLL